MAVDSIARGMAAAAAAGGAGEAVRKAQEAAKQAQLSASQAATSATSAAASADEAASVQTEADALYEILQGMSATAETLDAGEAATASYNTETGVFSFGIPKGTDGADADWADVKDKPFASVDGNSLTTENGVLKVNVTDDAEADNTQPISSSGVNMIVGNINALLSQI